MLKVKSRYRIAMIAALVCALLLPLLVAGAMKRGNVRKPTSLQLTPGLACIETTHNFGLISPEQALNLKHGFSIKNTSPRAIKIVKCTSSCGCTLPTLSKTELLPGDSVDIAVSVNWGNRDGKQNASVFLTSDEQTGASAVLGVMAIVQNPVVVWPRRIEFTKLEPGVREEQSFEVKQSDPTKSFQITGIVFRAEDGIDVSRIGDNNERLPLPGNPGRFVVSTVGARSKGVKNSRIEVRTSLGTEFTVVVSADSAGAITTTPSSLFFNRLQNTDAAISEVDVSAVLPPPGVTLSATIVSDDGDVPITVDRVTEEHKGSRLEGKIAVKYVGSTRRTVGTILRIRLGEDTLDVPVGAIGSGRD